MSAHKGPFSARAYRHFDAPLSPIQAEKIATNAERVARHSFLPFIRRTVLTPRYRKEERKVRHKERIIAYASHADAVIYSYYGELLSNAYEDRLRDLGLERVPMAYRRFSGGMCNIHFARTAFKFIADARPCVALGFDVQGFFDNIDHSLLMSAWRELLGVDSLPKDHYKIFRSLTRWSWVDEALAYRKLKIRIGSRSKPGERLCTLVQFKTRIRERGFIKWNKDTFGIPQGSPMSAVLSNIYLLPFDQTLQQFASSCGGFVQRYCDDVLVVVPPEFKDQAIEVVVAAAQERKLTIHTDPRKLDLVEFPDPAIEPRSVKPIQYLGLTFDGERILVRSQTLSRYHRKIRFYLRRASWHAKKNPHNRRIYTKNLNTLYTCRGDRNFITYAQRCANLTQSPAIKKQIKRHGQRIRRWVDEMQP